MFAKVNITPVNFLKIYLPSNQYLLLWWTQIQTLKISGKKRLSNALVANLKQL